MKCYISFSNEDVFSDMALLEEPPVIPPKEAMPKGTQPTLANAPVKEATVDICMESTAERKLPNPVFWLGEGAIPLQTCICHQADSPSIERPKTRPHSQSFGERLVQHCQTDESRILATQSEPPSPIKESEVVWQTMLPTGFAGVTACLWRDQLSEEVYKVSSGPLGMGVVLGPALVTMSTSCIVRDEVTGVTYMDTVTTLVGQVTLSGPKQEASV